VFFQWQHQKDELIKAFKARGITFEVIDGTVTSGKKRAEIEQHFQRGFYRCLLLQPQSTAHGLTLTRATTAIWASPTINYEHWKQGNHRHDRAGQTERTETIVLVAPGTKDVEVYENCMVKGVKAYKLLDNM
jgi:SNF2 family DNA or RNA helicase